jgi:solute carrier family 35 protein F5
VRSWRSFLIYIDSHGTRETLQRDILEPEDEGEYNEDGPDDAASIHQRQGLLRSYREDEIEEGISAKSVMLSTKKLGLKETARLAAQFCLLWFAANYFALACLQYTTVGSTTILTSTSGVWTLIFGAMIGVEKFTMRKCLGVLASLAGVILISSVDMSSSSNDEIVSPPPTLAIRSSGSSISDGDDGGSFPNKTSAEIALGDAMAAFSAIIYGVYTIVMKKQVGDESRVNMQLFFGLVGFFNVFFLWPGFIVLHLTGIERFSLPSEDRIWMIILVCFYSLYISQKKSACTNPR